MLLSGNGRHRRPRQAPKFVVAAGVTGASVAIPLLGASGAQAASAETWDEVAQCESGGAWSINTDNGYFGGLQLSESTWEEFGGSAYAARPDLASRSEQIAVAERVLAERGPQAFAICAVQAGLQQGGEAPDVEAPDLEVPVVGASAAGEPPVESDDTGQAKTGEVPEKPAEPGTSATPGARGSGASEEPGSGSASEPTESSKGRNDPSPGANDSDSRESGVDRSSRDKSPNRDNREYIVVPGDSLSGIANAEDLDGGWTALYERNKATVGDDPDLILPGQHLSFG